MYMFLAVATGGAIGAIARHFVGGWIQHAVGLGFPWGTMGVNVIGSFTLGAVTEIMALAWSPTETLRALLTVGMLGAFTTFSAFSLDIVLMAERGDWAAAVVYCIASVALCVLALFCGLALFRALLT